MTTALQPIESSPPLTAPANPSRLEVATIWTGADSSEALRWLPAGVQIRMRTYRDPGAFGVWGAPWCVNPDDLDPEADLKTGPPPEDDDPEPFEAMSVWVFDRLQECGNLSATDRAEAIERARHTFAVREPLAAENQFAARQLTDAGNPPEVADPVAGTGMLEQSFGTANMVDGLIHARIGLLAHAENLRLVIRDPREPGVLRSPAGHRWVFGAGYAATLGNRQIGTTAIYGWRDEIEVREAEQYDRNQFVAVAERPLVLA